MLKRKLKGKTNIPVNRQECIVESLQPNLPAQTRSKDGKSRIVLIVALTSVIENVEKLIFLASSIEGVFQPLHAG